MRQRPSTPEAELAANFARDGYLILEEFLAPADIERLQHRAAELVDGFDPAETRTVFSTTDQGHARDRYFLESGDKIRFFFEEEALDTAGRLKVDKHLALNKIGHALHDLDPVFSRYSRSARLAAVATTLGVRAPRLVQSMYIFKQPYLGGEVSWHQDSSFLYTNPMSVIGFWLALDDATLENGCMTALAGAHRGPLRQRFVRRGDTTAMIDLDPAPWPLIEPTVLAVPRGSLVVLHGSLPHQSGPNRSPDARHAYALHVIDGDAAYAADNWLQRPALPLRGFS